MRLVARERERDAAIRGVRFGDGAVIVGAAGVGKSALAESVADVARADGIPVVKVLATAAGRKIPYAALGPLVPAEAELHPAFLPGLVVRRLAEVGGRRRPLLLVDDAHWLDDHSASALLGVIGQRAATLLLTARTGRRPSAAVTALWKEGLLDRIDLAPLDVDGTGELLSARLGGQVAAVTTQWLWERSQGNAFYLTELARYGVESGRLRATDEVWWWSGAADLPPRLAELLAHRLAGLTPRAEDVVDMLALAEPLPYDTLAAVCPPAAILDLERRGIVVSDADDAVVRLRLSHPLLRAAARDRLSAARRRALAGRLLDAPAEHVDLLRRATWQEAAGGSPDVDLLVRAARSLIVLDPASAIRFAERALPYDRGPSAAVTLADAQAESGLAVAAARSLETARALVRDPIDLVEVGLSEAGLHLWTDRDPERALGRLHRLAAELPPALVAEAESAAALMTLFRAHPADADAMADRVLHADVGAAARRRCLLVKLVAATLADRPSRARRAADELARVLQEYPHPAPARSMATAFAATADMFGGGLSELPMAGGPSGRWPAPHRAMGGDSGGPGRIAGPAWPLLEGVRLHLAGDCPGAAVALREATVQQMHGEGLFRSEAAGGLAVVLAECGRAGEAGKMLADNGPDKVAVIPGLGGWARAWILAGSGRRRAAGEIAVRTAAETAAVGAVSTAMWYLADAGRVGAARSAASVAETLAPDVGSDLTAARLMGIRARAEGAPELLLAAAEAHLSVGAHGHAAELAELAALGSDRPGVRSGRLSERARAVVSRARSAIGTSESPARPDPPGPLTRRESEIARLAAQGLRDRDIADELTLSVRTVESHLATAYRKLGIGSRRDLGAALGDVRPTR